MARKKLEPWTPEEKKLIDKINIKEMLEEYEQSPKILRLKRPYLDAISISRYIKEKNKKEK